MTYEIPHSCPFKEKVCQILARALNKNPEFVDGSIEQEITDVMVESPSHIQKCMRENPGCFFNLTPNNFPYSPDSVISLRQNNILAILEALKYSAEDELTKLQR